MKRLFAAIVLAMLGAGLAAAEQPPLSPAQFQKLLKFMDTIGAKELFPAPTAQNLGFSGDASQDLPVVVVVTNDHKVYFCRSQLDANDYVVWVRSPDNQASYMFSTHADLKLFRALYLRSDAFPKVDDVNSPQVQAIYRDALTALAKDVDQNAPR